MRTIKHELGNKDGIFAISYKDKDGRTHKAELTGVVLSAPADSESLADWHKGKSFTFGIGDDTVKFEGVEAAAAAKVLHDIETLRGKAREKLAGGASHEAVQVWLRKEMLTYWPGKQVVEVVKPIEVSMANIAEIMAIEDVAERTRLMGLLLAQSGATVTTGAEHLPESDVERQQREMAEAVDRRLAEQDEEENEE